MKKSRFVSEPASTEPSQLDRIEAKLDAIVAHFIAPKLNGSPVHKCGCGRLATSTTSVQHPFLGSKSQHLCDACEPTGEVRAAILNGGKVVSDPVSPEVQAHARRINGLLSS